MTNFLVRKCEQCGMAMPHRMHRLKNDKGQKVCPLCHNSPQPRWSTLHSGRVMNEQDQQEFSRREQEAFSSIMALRTGSLVTVSQQKLAHGIGDLMAIRHCPRCGSGDVIAQSSGVTSCGLCDLNFNVQVQPEFDAMPQSVGDQPYQDPSTADTPTQPSQAQNSADPAAQDPANPADPVAGAPGNPTDPAEATRAKVQDKMNGGSGDSAQPGDTAPDPNKPKNPVPPQFQKKTTSLMRQAALKHADSASRHLILDQIRADNGLTPFGGSS